MERFFVGGRIMHLTWEEAEAQEGRAKTSLALTRACRRRAMERVVDLYAAGYAFGYL